MAARDDPERIEIELTSRGPGTPATEPLVARSIDQPATAGRRLIGTVAVVGVVGLIAGVLIGRAGGGGDGSGARASSTTPVTIPVAADTPINTPPPTSIEMVTRLTTTSTSIADRSVDTSSRQVLPTAPGQSSIQVESSVVVAPAIAAFALEVVGLAVSGDLLRLDLATGRTTTQSFVDAPSGPPIVLAGDGWIARPSWDPRDDWLIVRDEGAASTSAMGDALTGFGHTPDGRFWAFEDDGAGGRVTEVALDGVPTGREFEVPGYPEGADPSGAGVVVAAPGGSYVVGEGASVRVTSGRLISLGRQRALALECDDALTCQHVVIDRATGVRRPITLDRAFGGRTSIRSATSWTTAQPFNLAEDAALVLSWDPFAADSELGGVLDLATGELIEITDRGDAAMMRWSPDGRSVIWLDRGRLRVFDLASRTSTDVSVDLPLLTAFTIRTALPSVEATATTTAADDSTPNG